MISYDVEWYHRIPPPVKEILQTLESAGREAYVVGGAVRDLWLGIEPKDFDLVSSASPEEIEKLFPKTVGVGRAFGIMVAVVGGQSVEIARFRTDGAYTDGRHPDSVQFASPEEDARRRDFTINALFYSPSKETLWDYVGGIKDLQNHLIRSVGNPMDRFEEDSLRMLRAVRFFCQLGGGFRLDPSLEEAIRQKAEKISVVSRERITQEFQKILLSDQPSLGLEKLQTLGLWKEIFPQQPALSSALFKGLEDFLPSLVPPNLQLPLFLAAMEWVSQPFLDKRLVLGKETKQSIQKILSICGELDKFSSMGLAKQKKLAASEEFLAALAIFASKNPEKKHSYLQLFQWRRELKEKNKLSPPAFLTGKDLLSLGFEPGPFIKNTLTQIEELQLEEKILSKEEALQLAKEIFLSRR